MHLLPDAKISIEAVESDEGKTADCEHATSPALQLSQFLIVCREAYLMRPKVVQDRPSSCHLKIRS